MGSVLPDSIAVAHTTGVKSTGRCKYCMAHWSRQPVETPRSYAPQLGLDQADHIGEVLFSLVDAQRDARCGARCGAGLARMTYRDVRILHAPVAVAVFTQRQGWIDRLPSVSELSGVAKVTEFVEMPSTH